MEGLYLEANPILARWTNECRRRYPSLGKRIRRARQGTFTYKVWWRDKVILLKWQLLSNRATFRMTERRSIVETSNWLFGTRKGNPVDKKVIRQGKRRQCGVEQRVDYLSLAKSAPQSGFFLLLEVVVREVNVTHHRDEVAKTDICESFGKRLRGLLTSVTCKRSAIRHN